MPLFGTGVRKLWPTDAENGLQSFKFYTAPGVKSLLLLSFQPGLRIPVHFCNFCTHTTHTPSLTSEHPYSSPGSLVSGFIWIQQVLKYHGFIIMWLRYPRNLTVAHSDQVSEPIHETCAREDLPYVIADLFPLSHANSGLSNCSKSMSHIFL